MIDQLHRFDSEAAAKAALPALLIPGDGGNSVWRADIVSFPRVLDTQMPHVVMDPDTRETTTQPTPLPYFYVWIATPVREEALESLPSCMIVADRALAAIGDAAFILKSALPAEQLSRYLIDGGPLGANYPFGG